MANVRSCQKEKILPPTVRLVNDGASVRTVLKYPALNCFFNSNLTVKFVSIYIY